MKPRNWINMNNGILDVDALLADNESSDCLHEHTSQWLNTVQLDYPFDEDARCDRWIKFLDEIMEGDQERIAVIQEAFGYCFWPTAELERFFIFIGDGQNGKSTTLNVLEALLGSPNIAALTPREFDNRSDRLALYGKIANLCNDMDEIDKFGEGLIKKMCSGEPIMAHRLYKGLMQWRPTTKLFFATNVMPRFVDVTQGIWRRAMIVPFDVQIPDAKKDIHLFQKLRPELSGVFLWAIQGMVRLLQNRKFTYSQECFRTQREERRRNFPILAFLDDMTEEDPNNWVAIHELWETYRKWCSDHGLTKPKPLQMFARDVYAFRPKIGNIRRADSDGMRKKVLMGIGLKNSTEILSYEEA